LDASTPFPCGASLSPFWMYWLTDKCWCSSEATSSAGPIYILLYGSRVLVVFCLSKKGMSVSYTLRYW
jgi:hypothetical protein